MEEGLRLANVQQAASALAVHQSSSEGTCLIIVATPPPRTSQMQEYLAQLAADIAALAQTTCQKAEGGEATSRERGKEWLGEARREREAAALASRLFLPSRSRGSEVARAAAQLEETSAKVAEASKEGGFLQKIKGPATAASAVMLVVWSV